MMSLIAVSRIILLNKLKITNQKIIKQSNKHFNDD